MAKGSSGLSGGGGGGGVSALTAFKENAKQLNDAKVYAKSKKAAELQYTDITGQTYNLYWDGAKYDTRRSSMAARYSGMSGAVKVKFKKPSDW